MGDPIRFDYDIANLISEIPNFYMPRLRSA